MGGSASKRKGSSFERAVVEYLATNGFPYAERAYGAGRPEDVGDIDGIVGWCLEAKAHKEIDLAGFMDEAVREAANVDALLVKRGVSLDERLRTFAAAIIKRRMKGIEHSYVVMELHDWARLVRQAER